MKKPKYLILALIIALGCLGYLAIDSLRSGAAAGLFYEEDFTAFKEKRLRLPARQEPVCLVAVGDIMLSRGVAREIRKYGDFNHPFTKIKDCLKSGDIVFGNLENPVTRGREIMTPEMILRADPGVEVALKDAGFTVLSLANNHLPDFGPRGLLDTLQYLNNAGIESVGAGQTDNEAYAAKFIEVKGLMLAFLAYNDLGVVPDSYLAGVDTPGTAFLDGEKMRAAVKNAREKADFVVVSMHAGTEYASGPDRIQIQFAHQAIDAGADLVLGHHPHVVQKVEQYKGKYIFYSLGNFVFDQMWSRDTREGLAAKIFINQSGVEKVEFLPIYINDHAQPEVLKDEEARSVLKNLGLDLKETVVPAWDQEKQVFVESKKYTTRSLKPWLAFKLIKNRRFDLDQDGMLEDYFLQDGKVKVETGSQTIWQSPEDWWVDDFFLGDSNNDGIYDLNLLVWKAGSFGPSKPFWMTGEDKSIKNHLFIFKLVNGFFKPVWQSSNLDRPNYEAALEDLDGDGKNELVVTEGSYADPGERQVSIWKWNGWGFSRISEE